MTFAVQAMVQTLVSRLRHLVALVEDLSLRPVIARVARILLDQEASFCSEEDSLWYYNYQKSYY